MPFNAIRVESPCRPMQPVLRPVAGHTEVHDGLTAATSFATEHRYLSPGQELFSEFDRPDYVFVVIDGWLMLRRILEDGRQQILDFALPGAIVGDPTGTGGRLTYSVEAVTTAHVAAIPLGRIPALIASVPSFALTMLRAASDSLGQAYESLTDTGRRTAREAVASFVLRMEARVRAAGGGTADGRVEFPLTQENIGDSIGLTAVHVCRTLRALKSEGLIETGRGSLLIRKRAALQAIAGVIEDDDAKPAADLRIAV